MKIGDRIIGGADPPYMVAEISGNHGGDLKKAIELIKVAKKIGADAVKTQCYEADTITLDCNKLDFIAQSGLWKGTKLYELYKRACTPFKWHKELYSVAAAEGITIFSSVFDFSSVDLLESLDCPAYKIASFEIVDIPLIRYAHSTGKPLIISTGLGTDAEILDANEATEGDAAYLHCTSEYPGTVETADLDRILRIRALLKHRNPVGISDHSVDEIVPTAATVLGATIIEKHLRLKGLETEDSSFSLDPGEFEHMILVTKSTHEAMKQRPPLTSGKQYRRSLYAVQDIKKGEVFTEDNIRSIRPGFGLPPKMYPVLLGRRAQRDYRRGDPLT